MGKHKKKPEKRGSKPIALFFIIIMFGSTFAFALLNVFSGPKEQPQPIPESGIMNRRLTPEEQNFLIQRGFTLIDFSYPSDCFDCEILKGKLEEMTRNAERQIILQEVEGNSTQIIVTSINGESIINSTSETEVQNAVCDLLLNPPLWCINI